MNKILLTAVFLGASFVSASAQHVMFRGENHCGIYPDKLDVVSEFRFTDGSGACFSHPTIFDGVMYIRRGPALVAYKVKG